MKGRVSSQRRRNFSTLNRATDIPVLQALEQRQLLSATLLPAGGIPSGTQDSNPSAVWMVNGTGLFFADDATGTQHLYETNGTSATLVDASISGIAGSGGNDSPVVSGDNLFFVANSSNGQQVYEATVATAGGTATDKAFTSITPDNGLDRYTITNLATVGSGVYFVTDDNNNTSTDTTPDTLYDATVSGSTNVGSFDYVGEIGDLNGQAIFSADNGGTNTDYSQLYTSNGTLASTQPLMSGTGDNASTVYYPSDFVANKTSNPTELFLVADGTLYTTDGTASGTVAVPGSPDVNSYSGLVVLNGKAYFSGYDSGTSDYELYQSDGTTASEVGTQASGPSDLTVVGNDVYFNGIDATGNNNAGNGLWKSDGTTETVVSEISSTGTGSSSPNSLTASGSELFFEAQPAGSGNDQLFATDGSTVTQLTTAVDGDYFSLSNLSAGPSGTAYFSYDDGIHGQELWQATSTGASLIDVNTTPTDQPSSTPNDTVQVGSTLYFVTNDNGNDELWKTDGTAAGTTQINVQPTITTGTGSNTATTNIPLASGVTISDLMAGTGVVYFESNADGTDSALWVYNGTTASLVQYTPATSPATTTPVDITGVDLSAGYAAVVGNTLFFAYDDSQSTDDLGTELWSVNGASSSTASMVTDIDTVSTGTGNDTGSSNPTSLYALSNTQLIFTANDGTGAGADLWVSDGTPVGTTAIKQLDSSQPSSINLDSFSVVNNVNNTYGYFTDNDVLWRTDGTASGTIPLGDFLQANLGNYTPSSTTAPPVINGSFFFAADANDTNDNDGNPLSLWKTDGTAAGTVLVQSFAGSTAYYSYNQYGFDPTGMVNLNPTTIVFGANGADGNELWKSDGTTAGTVQVADISPGEAGSFPGSPNDYSGGSDFVVTNGEVYFPATTLSLVSGDDDTDLWKSDGTAAGTQQVTKINPAGGYYSDSDVANVTLVGSKILFTADDGANNTELWETDGTATGTFIVADVNAINGQGGASTPTTLNSSTAVFFADNGTSGYQPYSVIVPNYNISISAATVSVPENGTGTFDVVLTAMPASNVTVTIAEAAGGSADLSAGPTTLTFTPADWQTAQTVTIAGGIADGAVGSAGTFDVTTDNLPPQAVTATETASTSPILILTPTSIDVPEGGTQTFNVSLAAAPVGTFTVTIADMAGDTSFSASSTTLTFNSSNYSAGLPVTISSPDDLDTADQTTTFTLSSSGFPDQTVAATQLDKDGPAIGAFTVNPPAGTSKSTIKLAVTGVTASTFGAAKYVLFYQDTNLDGVEDAGDTLLKTVKLSKKGAGSYSLKAKNLSVGATTFFAVAEDTKGNLTGMAQSGTFTLSAPVAKSTAKKAAVRSAAVIASAPVESSSTQDSSITQNLFSQTPVLG